MTQSVRRLLLSLLAFVWLVAIISLFYTGHKPFTPQFALIFSKGAGQFIVALLVVIVGGGTGRRLLPAISLRPASAVVLQASLGLGLLSLLVLVVGASIGINPLIGWVCLVLLVILLRREILSWIRDLRGMSGVWKASGRLGKAVLVAAVFACLAMLPAALSPPLKFDALVYHLTLPRAYLDAGKVVYIPQSMYWGMPQTGEMLYTWAMSLAGTQTATVLGWAVGILALAGIMSYTCDRLSSQAAWIALAGILSTYTLLMILPTGYIDWFMLLFGFCFLTVVEGWWSTGDNRLLVFAGIFAGFALGTKYTAGILIIAGVVAVIIHSRQDGHRLTHLIYDLARILLPAVVITLPWWLKNLSATGNPFYPFFIPSGSMDRYRLDMYQLPAWGDWRELLLLPFRATITGYEGSPGYSATISPLFLGLCPFAFLGWRKRPVIQQNLLIVAAVIGLSALFAWGLASRLSGYLIQSRLYFAAFPAFALLAGAGFMGISTLRFPGLRTGRIVAVLVLLVFGFSLLQEITDLSRQGSSRVFLGLETADIYLGANLGWYYPATQAISALPSGAQVLMLFEPRSFYCQPKCVADEVLDRWKHDRRIFGDPANILASWLNAGYTHLLYNKFGADFLHENDSRFDASDWTALEQLVKGLKHQEDFGSAYILYSLRP